MKVVLATGIYPPDIGGPATYVSSLAQQLSRKGVDVTVVTYGKRKLKQTDESVDTGEGEGRWRVVRVPKAGGPTVRWWWYSQVLRSHAMDADIVYAFSSVSVGVPLWMASLRHPRKILRLGGDFLWERYTDRGGTLGLREWYESGPRFRGVMNGLLRTFDHIVFSTEFQEKLFERFYTQLPLHSVIENALPEGRPVRHTLHNPFRLLYLGRFVAFKNLVLLLNAVKELPACHLTLVGRGPLHNTLQDQCVALGIAERVMFQTAQYGEDKKKVLAEQDLLVLPSRTEISPNAALEARTAGLPVLLTEETGLSRTLSNAMFLRPMRTVREVVTAVNEAMDQYGVLADRAAADVPQRSWETVAEEHLTLFRSLL